MTYALAVREIFAKFSMKALPPGCKTEEIYLPLVKVVLLPDEELLPCHYGTKSEKREIFIYFLEFIVNFKILLALIVFMTLKNFRSPREKKQDQQLLCRALLVCVLLKATSVHI